VHAERHDDHLVVGRAATPATSQSARIRGEMTLGRVDEQA
jgi:hypothetical protein